MSRYAYCCECREDTIYHKVEQQRYWKHHKYQDKSFPFTRIACICSKCFNEVFVPSVHDMNCEVIKRGYEKLCEKN